MSETGRRIRVDVRDWIARVRRDPVEWRRRQTGEVVLATIASLLPRHEFRLKGGTLMGLAHASPRMTTDIDLSAGFPPRPGISEVIGSSLDAALRPVTLRLGYMDLAVRVHSVKALPKGEFERSRFPALKIKIVHSRRMSDTREYLDIDISFNDPLGIADILLITDEDPLFAYGLVELVAEKYRALLQQIPRRRQRHQDVYDLHLLLTGNETSAAFGREILEMMLEKCRSRGIEPERDSLNDPEVRRRSEANWKTLRLELETTPGFFDCFAPVKRFYESLPWP